MLLLLLPLLSLLELLQQARRLCKGSGPPMFGLLEFGWPKGLPEGWEFRLLESRSSTLWLLELRGFLGR